MPNMDEVVRDIKDAIEDTPSPYYDSKENCIRDLRLLIEEREQKDAEIFNARSLRDFAVKKSNELIVENEQLKLDKVEIVRHLGEKIAGLEFEVARQDKEIQHLRNALREISFGHDSAMHLQIIAEKALNQA